MNGGSPPGARAPTAPHPPAPDRPRLSVVVPAFGEQARIAATVESLHSALRPVVGTIEVVVVDDGSADATASRATDAGAESVIRLPVNRGKGAAVRAGMLAASGSALVFTDADLSYPPDQITRVLDAIEQGWDVVVGNRHHVDTKTLVGGAIVREISGRVFNQATRVIIGRSFGDTQCGLKGFHRDAAAELFSRSRIDGFAFDVEILWLAGHLGLAVTEVPVDLASAEGSTVRLSAHAPQMLRDLVRLRRWGATGAYGPPPPT